MQSLAGETDIRYCAIIMCNKYCGRASTVWWGTWPTLSRGRGPLCPDNSGSMRDKWPWSWPWEVSAGWDHSQRSTLCRSQYTSIALLWLQREDGIRVFKIIIITYYTIDFLLGFSFPKPRLWFILILFLSRTVFSWWLLPLWYWCFHLIPSTPFNPSTYLILFP